MINVQIVEDHKLFADTLKTVIQTWDKAEVSDVYYDLKSCRKGLEKMLPDILLLDIFMPDGDGVEFCAEIMEKYRNSKLKIIMLTGYQDYNIVKKAVTSGAFGYITKDIDNAELLDGIETVSRGEHFFCKKIDALMKDRQLTDTVWLTDIERQIMALYSEGCSTRMIADKLGRSPQTIKAHIKDIRMKLNISKLPKANPNKLLLILRRFFKT
jgi:DNA-binding NarL/FixJ family response regulator